MLLVAYPVYNHGGRFGTAEPELKLGISPAKTPRPQRSENNNKQFFQDNLSSLRNLTCFAPWRESSLLIASFMSNSKCLHLRGTTLAARSGGYLVVGIFQPSDDGNRQRD